MDFWDWTIFWDDAARLGVAALLGGTLGFEREWKGHWAGLRTHMMVSIGAALFILAGLIIAKGEIHDTTRIVQGVASGIGFLGAGTILKLSDRQEIQGLTTASSIWLAAALGVVAGLGIYPLAIAAAIVSLFILAVLPPVEELIARHVESLTSNAEKDSGSSGE